MFAIPIYSVCGSPGVRRHDEINPACLLFVPHLFGFRSNRLLRHGESMLKCLLLFPLIAAVLAVQIPFGAKSDSQMVDLASELSSPLEEGTGHLSDWSRTSKLSFELFGAKLADFDCSAQRRTPSSTPCVRTMRTIGLLSSETKQASLSAALGEIALTRCEQATRTRWSPRWRTLTI